MSRYEMEKNVNTEPGIHAPPAVSAETRIQVLLEEYRALSPHFDQDLYGKISLEAALRDKTVTGGTAPERVREEIQRWKKELAIS